MIDNPIRQRKGFYGLFRLLLNDYKGFGLVWSGQAGLPALVINY